MTDVMELAEKRRRPNPVILVFAILLLFYWAAAALILLVDPLNLYPWGAAVRISDSVSPEQKPALLVPAATDPQTDLVLIGSSVSALYSTHELREWLPGTRHPANLSYNQAGFDDNQAVLKLVGRAPSVKRVILFYHPVTYLQSPGGARPDIPMYLLDDSSLNDLRMVNSESLYLAVQAVWGRPLHDGSRYFAGLLAFRKDRFNRFQSPGAMAELAGAVRNGEAILARETAPLNCAAYPGLDHQLLPFARKMSARGVRLDIVMPLLSHAYYGQWASAFGNTRQFQAQFAKDLVLRRCIVTAINGLPHVGIYAFEEPWLAGDMANFMDPGHFESRAGSKYMFSNLNDAHRLTTDNIDIYISKLRESALTYKVYNSKVGSGNLTGSR